MGTNNETSKSLSDKYESAIKNQKFLPFIKALKESVDAYSGVHADILSYSPDFFAMIVSLYKKNLASPYKYMINSTISYFVLPDDILPEEELGVLGYLEDLYLCAHVIEKLSTETQTRDMVKELWQRDEDVFKVAKKIIEEIEETPNPSIQEAIREVLTFSGINEIEKQIENQVPTNERPDTTSTTSKEREILRSNELLQDRIPVTIMFHLASKAKYNNMLNSYLRKALYDFASKKHKQIEFSQKQIDFLENILQQAIDEGIVEASCEDDPCDKCIILKELIG